MVIPRHPHSQDEFTLEMKVDVEGLRMEIILSQPATRLDGFLRSNCTSTEQEYILLHQPDVGVDDEKETTAATSQRAAAREEFASPTEKRQQQGTTAWATEQNE